MENKPLKKERIMQFIMSYTPWIAVIFVIIFIVVATLDWDKWWSDARYQTTDNAYVKTDPTILKSRVTGFISEIKKEDYQIVKQNEVIASINNDEQLLNKEVAIAELKKSTITI
ncbi:HlyD family secretion protein [Shigella sp. FC1967]|uniref:hypothetical protein n=1 Tax=Shigella sp. FC1967 TaxID=1898041 RepID=UPI00257120ED|nr:hypothetical protein [Shigella sp. FC1967]